MLLVFMIACGDDTSTGESTIKSTEVKTETPKILKGQANSLGKKMFLLCTACHSLKKGEPSKVGPNLHGVFGQKAGYQEAFKYSDALKNSEIFWDEKTMYKWIENPVEYIPGTIMAFVGIKKEEQINALIEFLKEETK